MQTKLDIMKLKPGLNIFHAMQPGNGSSLFHSSWSLGLHWACS